MKLSLTIATGVAAAVLTMSGCGREVIVVQAPAPTTTESTTTTTEPAPQTTAPRPVAPSMSDEDYYVLAVRTETSLGAFMTDYDMLETGYMICDFLRAGGTAEEVAAIIYESGMSSGAGEDTMLDFAALSGLAVSWLCPDQGWKV